jgi:hypothetical protein
MDDLHVRPARRLPARHSTAFDYTYVTVAEGGMTMHRGELVRPLPPLRALSSPISFPFPSLTVHPYF